MANVQLENGYTRLANEILNEIIKLPLSGTQFRIVLFVWRNSYGFQKKECEFSESYIAKAIGASKRFISSELLKLINMRLIKVVRESTFTTPRVLSFNKNYEEWGSNVQQVKDPSTVEEMFNSTVEGSFNTTVEGSFHQINKYLKKELKKDDHTNFFESLWNLYPNKKGKAKVTKKKIQELEKIGFDKLRKCIERYKQDKPAWKEWQHGSTFFNGGYLDYLDENYSQPIEQDLYSNIKL